MGNGSELRSATLPWIDDPDFVSGLIERTVQTILDAEMTRI